MVYSCMCGYLLMWVILLCDVVIDKPCESLAIQYYMHNIERDVSVRHTIEVYIVICGFIGAVSGICENYLLVIK